jgi:trehalose/maltose hydrolase-like predicted phosphorylase
MTAGPALAAGPVLSDWTLVYQGFDPAQEALREALCALGNGRFASRAAAPEADSDGIHYPGTYAAGCYNRLTSEVGGREVEDESIVNLPNWLPLSFRIIDGDWFDVAAVKLAEYRQELDLRRSLLTRRLRFEDAQGRETEMTERRFLSMADPNLAAIQTTLLPLNWSGGITFRSALDGRVINAGVARYHGLASRHLIPIGTSGVDSETIELEVETSQSHIRLAEAARTRIVGNGDGDPLATRLTEEGNWIGLELDVEAAEGEAIAVEKVVALCTSREPAVSEPAPAARREVSRAGSFGELLADHELRWNELWDLCSIELENRLPTVTTELRLHIHHLLGTISEHTVDPDAGVPARGLAGEAYRGHVFWDTLFITPFLTLRLPDLARTLLRYRFRRLRPARWAASDLGCEGALYPWQSGLEGTELTPTVHLNPRSGHWVEDNSRLQMHINSAVAYDVWKYHQATNDVEFLAFYGAEMFLEIARFWASLAELDPARERYVIRGVVGPDEYHDAYPGAERPGIDNNAYTNAMAAWVLWRAREVLESLPAQRREELSRALRVGPEELDRWDEISRTMFIPFHDGVISQFEGYEELEELDWKGYRERYGNIERLDRILEAEEDTPNRYKASKQADVLMLFYLLSGKEISALFERLGYELSEDAASRNVEYYLARTSDGSTLSKCVHAWVLAQTDPDRSWGFFSEALESDLFDTQGGTTPEGVHLGAMAGTVDLVQRAYTGIETREEVLWLDPRLPEGLKALRFSVRFRRHWGIEIEVTPERVRVRTRPAQVYPMRLGIKGELIQLGAGETVERPL